MNFEIRQCRLFRAQAGGLVIARMRHTLVGEKPRHEPLPVLPFLDQQRRQGFEPLEPLPSVDAKIEEKGRAPDC